MLKLTKTGVGLLTRQYRSVLKKCWAINVGLFVATTILTTMAPKTGYAERDVNNTERWAYSNYYVEIRPINAMIDLFAGGFLSSLDENNLRLTSGGVERANYSWDGLFFSNSSEIVKTLLTETQFQLNGSTTVTGIDTAVAAHADKLITSGAVKTFVESKGYLTSSSLSGYATKSTTLSGYGITDAYTKTEVDNLISGSGSSYSAGTGISIENDTISLNTTYLDNNYYRKDKKSGILNGFEEGKIGNKNDDNFSKLTANDNFAITTFLRAI